MQRSNWIRLATFVAWLLAASSAVYWALQFAQGPAAPSAAVTVSTSKPSGTAVVDAQALARGLGGGVVAAGTSGAPAPASSIQAGRFQLTGVVVNRSGQAQTSVALIAVDGKPARPYRVGTTLAEGVVLHSVAAGKAMLSNDAQTPPALTLELPRQVSAVVGTAVVSRPVLPAGGVAAPPPPTVMPGNPATPMAATGQRAPRPAANRPREGAPEERSN